MLTSHCRHCGAPKTNFADDYCDGCAQTRNETREYVVRENRARNEHNATILTPENKAALQRAAEIDMTGSAARALTAQLGLKPIIDLSAALRDAMVARAHHTNTGHTDPRAVFQPGLTDARTAGLGMNSHVPPGRTLVPGAPAPEVQP